MASMLPISRNVSIPDKEIDLQAIRAQGAGGQNINKVATAIQLRFDIPASSLPEMYKQRLLNLTDRRINKEGVLTIKAQRFRSQEQNRLDALMRLQDLVRSVSLVRKKRIATRVPSPVRQKRLDAKTRRGKLKSLRRRISED